MESFVGREAEADALRQQLDATRGVGSLLIVRGDSGIGKTRLVQEVTADRTALWCRTSPEDLSGTLESWRRMFAAAQRAGILSGADMLAALESRASATVESAQRVSAVVSSLRVVAESTEDLVVIVDDAQWLDNESLAVIRSMMLERDDLPLAVIIVIRTGYELQLPRPDAQIELSGLSSAAVGLLIEQVIGSRPATEVIDLAKLRTGGNPLFVAELARALRAEGHDTEASAWANAVPDSALALLTTRFRELPPSTQSMLAALAVLGPDAKWEEVCQVTGMDRSAVTSALGPAVDAGLVSGAASSAVNFHHALAREAVLHAADASELTRFHHSAAQVLEVSGDVRSAGAIARHYEALGDSDATLRWARVAGDHASMMSRHDEAVRWYRLAISLNNARTAELLVALAESLSRVGDLEEARALFGDVATEARSCGDVTLLARAALGVGSLGGSFEVRMLDSTQVALLEEALERLSVDEPEMRSLVQARLSVALTMHGERQRRLGLADEAVNIARAVGDDRTLVVALAAWCDAHAGPEDLNERLDATREQLAAATRLGDAELLLLSHRFRIVSLMERGDIQSAQAEIRSYSDVASRLQVPAFRWYAWVAQGMLALLHGDLDEAERLARLAIEDGVLAGSNNAMMLAKGALLASIFRERGEYEAFLSTLAEGNAGLPEAERGFPYINPLFLIGYGTDVLDASELVAQLPDDLSFADGDALALLVWSTLGSAAAYVGDEQRAMRALERLAPFADRLVLDGTASVCLGPVAGTLARLHAAAGRHDEADAMYERAITTCRELGAPLLLARLESERRNGPPNLVGLSTQNAGQPTSVVGKPPNQFTKEGATWLITFSGASIRLRDSKGLRDLAVLIARPGREVHVFDLIDAAEGSAQRPDERVMQGELGPNLDATARSAYESRIRELTYLLYDADANNDTSRINRIEEERDALLHELAGALGLSGRTRPQGSDVERARKATSMRIRDAIKKLGAEHPSLGRHLTNSVHTGVFCSYRPEQPTIWN
jgi:tetratricopeptide (TPR) repeat protein